MGQLHPGWQSGTYPAEWGDCAVRLDPDERMAVQVTGIPSYLMFVWYFGIIPSWSFSRIMLDEDSWAVAGAEPRADGSASLVHISSSREMKKIFISTLYMIFLIISIAGYSPVYAEEVRMTKDGGVYHLPVRINDVIELKFIVDTGASDVSIPADVAMTLIRAEAITDSDFRGKAAYQMADGSISQNEKINLRSLKIGSQIIYNIEASVASAKGMLLLGQSALSKIEPWRIDTRQGLFIFGESTENGDLPVSNKDAKMSCKDFSSSISYETRYSNQELLKKLAKLDYMSRYDDDIIGSLCQGGDMKHLEHLIDYGYIELSTVEAIKKALGLEDIKINGERTKEGLKYEKTYITLSDMGLCHACAAEAARQFVEQPTSNCAKLVKKAITGDKSAANKINSDSSICKWAGS